jgi:hypothetical protein
VGVDEFVEAIMVGDLARLGALICGRDASKIRVDIATLPRDLPRRPGQVTVGLLDISAAVGGAPLRYLLEFFGLKPTIDSLHQAIASGDNESIHMIWDRLSPLAVATNRLTLAKTAAGFHFVDVVNWLLKDARRWVPGFVRKFASEHRLMDVILGMTDLPDDVDWALFGGSMAAAYEGEVRDWLPDVTDLKLLAWGERRDAASVNAFIDAAVGHARTLTFIETENRKSICGAFLGPA